MVARIILMCQLISMGYSNGMGRKEPQLSFVARLKASTPPGLVGVWRGYSHSDLSTVDGVDRPCFLIPL
jgi:hypothetical protein